MEPERPDAARASARPLATDAAGRVGEVMDRRTLGERHLVYLRPVGGGLEWSAPADEVVLVEDLEAAEQTSEAPA